MFGQFWFKYSFNLNINCWTAWQSKTFFKNQIISRVEKQDDGWMSNINGTFPDSWGRPLIWHARSQLLCRLCKVTDRFSELWSPPPPGPPAHPPCWIFCRHEGVSIAVTKLKARQIHQLFTIKDTFWFGINAFSSRFWVRKGTSTCFVRRYSE